MRCARVILNRVKDWGSRSCLDYLAPGLAFTLAEQASNHVGEPITSKLTFNMSVTPFEKNSENIRDSGKPRYGSPTLRSFQLYPLVSAVLTSY